MIKPLGDKVVIKRLEAEEKTKGGIILSSSAKETPQVAEVLAVGPGTEDIKMEVKTGDKVIFTKYGGSEIEYDGETLIILSQKDILAVIQ
ncbi:MAG: co-chaperone GroES [Anaerovoracaceae bacterium]